jgi:hypothetical protein
VAVTRNINDEWAIGKSMQSKRSGMFPRAFTVAVTVPTQKPPPPPLPTGRRPLTTTPGRANAAPVAVSPFGDDDVVPPGKGEREEAYGQSVSELRKRLFAGQ